jgi:acyl-coenzyme A synthetase/AMP-(fatty) acid ligase
MKLIVLNDDGTKNIHNITKNSSNNKDKTQYIHSSKKEQNALKIINNFYSNNKIILYDDSNKTIESKLNNLDDKIFNNYDFSMMFFTSGSTGIPTGALKTKENLTKEIEVFSELIKEYNIKKVIVTVPFVHIYGTLIGLLYPLLNGIDIVLKEHFLPFNLLDTIEENSLIVATPLYINALNKVQETKDLSKSLFVSSTAPLMADDAKEFCTKFNTNILQLFGSTETSGIAYKYNDEQLWTPLKSVKISSNKDNELHIKSPFVSNILYENDFKHINGQIQTFDFVEIQKDNRFKLLGRSSKILKVAGKRYSTIQIENILEDIEQINKALVFVKKNKKDIKNELLDITLEASKEFTSKEIKNILKSKLSNLKFSIELNYVKKISTNQIGKKLII